MQRVKVNDIPLLYGAHTLTLREQTEGFIQSTLKSVTDHTIVINFADYINSCTTVNMYKCCLPKYTTEVFSNARFFMDNLLLSDTFEESLYPDFSSALRLFGIDTAILCFWFRSFMEVPVNIWPTLPLGLVEHAELSKRLTFTSSSWNDLDPDRVLSLVGGVQNEFRYAGEFNFLKMILQGLEDPMDTMSRYYCNLFNSLKSSDYSNFPLCYDYTEIRRNANA